MEIPLLKNKKMPKALQKQKISEAITKAGLSPDTIDLEALIDETLTYQENYKAIMETLNIASNIDVKGLEAQANKNKIEEVQENARQELQEALNSQITANEPSKALENLAENIRMVARGHFTGCFCVGNGGLGKTFTTLKTLNEEKKPFQVLNTHITALALYQFLYEHNNEIIILEDCEHSLHNETIVSILRSALWGAVKNSKGEMVRTINYRTTSKQAEGLPTQFTFSGRIILLANKLPRTEQFEALKTRVLYQEMEFTLKDMKLMLTQIAKTGYKELNTTDTTNIVSQINDFVSVAHKNINIRLLEKAFEFYRYNKETWLEKFKQNLETDELLAVMDKIFSQALTSTEQYAKWNTETGFSKAYFYKIRKEYCKLQGVVL